ncbi:hypothetical protein RV10_GL002604 [Enterococcus pallens]|nr:hypothetical protein RV10_GL002604 [Enterococcus pallens]
MKGKLTMRRGENIYKRKDKRWEGRYAVGKNADGKTKYRSVYSKTLQGVRKKLYPLKMKYQLLQERQGRACFSFQEWGMQWLQQVKQEVKESTYANYEHKLCHYVLSVIGEYSLNELDKETGLELLRSLQQRNLKPSTIQVVFRIVKQCMNQAVDQDLLKANPFAAVKLPKVEKRQQQALTKFEQKNLEEVAIEEETSNGLPTLLALHAGLRIGEIAALSWEDINFKTNSIHVRATYQRIFSLLEEQKTKLIYTSSKTVSSVRSIPMSKLLKKVLLKHKEQSKGKFVFSTAENPSEPRLLTYHFHKIRKKANLEHVHFHQLRHTFATRCIESKGDIKSVSQMMGHSSTQLTLDTYTSSFMEQKVQVVRQMEKAIS